MKILYPMTVNYDILFQRPQQLLMALAESGHTCYFINYEPGYEGEYKCEEPTEVKPNFWVLPMNTTPPMLDELDIDIFYYSYPVHYPQAHQWASKGKMVIFDVIDAPVDEFHIWSLNWEQSVKDADLVLTVSDLLYEKAKVFNTIMVENGVDYNKFQVKSKDYIKTDKKVVGFTGAIASWVDIDLLVRACNTFPDVHFAILGVEYNDSIKNPPENLTFYGHKKHDDLPYWMVDFDVTIIPFKKNEVTDNCSPLKFWEYLSIGKPIVTTALPETKLDGVYWAKDDDEFISMLEDALQLSINSVEYKERVEALKEHGRNSSWCERIKQIEKFI